MNPKYDMGELMKEFGDKDDGNAYRRGRESVALQRASVVLQRDILCELSALKELLKSPNGWTRVQGYVPRNGDDDGPPLTTGVLMQPDTPDRNPPYVDMSAPPSGTDAAIAAVLAENKKTMRRLTAELEVARMLAATLNSMRGGNDR